MFKKKSSCNSKWPVNIAQIIKMTTIRIQLEVAADFGSLTFPKLHKTSAFHMQFLLIGLCSWIMILTFVFGNLSGFNLSSTRENTSSEFQRTVLWHTRWLYRHINSSSVSLWPHTPIHKHTHTHPPIHPFIICPALQPPSFIYFHLYITFYLGTRLQFDGNPLTLKLLSQRWCCWCHHAVDHKLPGEEEIDHFHMKF